MESLSRDAAFKGFAIQAIKVCQDSRALWDCRASIVLYDVYRYRERALHEDIMVELSSLVWKEQAPLWNHWCRVMHDPFMGPEDQPSSFLYLGARFIAVYSTPTPIATLPARVAQKTSSPSPVGSKTMAYCTLSFNSCIGKSSPSGTSSPSAMRHTPSRTFFFRLTTLGS